MDQYEKCNNCTLDNCKVCKFNEDRTRPICEECSEGLKININGECDYCQDYPHYEQNKNCLKCDKIYEVINCTCLPGFVENQNEPNSKYLECPSECPNDCIYNTEINSLTCTRCQEGYSFNSEGQCTYCGSSCASCEFNEDNNPTCLKCLNEYYLNENNECLPCDFGCVSCEFGEDNNVICLKCSENYGFNTQNKCESCQGECLSCEFDENNEMSCLTCPESYALTPDKTCTPCEDNCLNCQIDEKGNSLCLNCSEGYILSQNKKCISCDPYCMSCESDENDNPICSSCFTGYTVGAKKNCVQCEENCEKCEIDEKGNFGCLRCQYGYFLSSNKSCLNCGPYCNSESCTIDINNNPICSLCFLEAVLYNGKCIECPEGCSECTYDESSGNTQCIECSNSYVLNPKNNECLLCSSLPEIGEECFSCDYNNTSEKYECLSCETNINFIYINNTHKCLDISNDEENLGYLMGCEFATFDEKENKYQCTQCRHGLIFIQNENICRDIYDIGLDFSCLEAEKIASSEEYSCIKCSEGTIRVTYGPLGKVNCIFPSDNFILCSEVTVGDNGENQKCKKM